MDIRYKIINEEKAREQFEKFMNGVYEEIDELSIETSSNLFDAFNKLTGSDADKSVEAKNKFFIPTFTQTSLSYSEKLNELSNLEYSLDTLSYKELKNIARNYNVKGYSSMRRDLLIMEIGKAINKVKDSLTDDYNSSNDSYKKTMKAEFPGIKGYVSNKVVDIKYLIESVDDSNKKTYYEKLLNVYVELENDINLFDKFKKDHEETLKLIRYTQDEVERIENLIMFEEHKLNNATDSLSRLVVSNNIDGLNAQKAVHLNNINRYQENINKLFNKYNEFSSAIRCRESIISKIETLDTLLREGVIDEIIDIDSTTFKEDRNNLKECINEVDNAFDKAVKNETKLNEMLDTYGLSKIENNTKEEVIEENNEQKTVTEEPVSVVNEENIEEVTNEPIQEKIEEILPGIPEEDVKEESHSSYTSFVEPEQSKVEAEDSNSNQVSEFTEFNPVVENAYKAEEKIVEEPVNQETKTDEEYTDEVNLAAQKRVDSIENPQIVSNNYYYSVYADRDDVEPNNEEENVDDKLDSNDKSSSIGEDVKTNIELGVSAIKNGAVNAVTGIKNKIADAKESTQILKEKIKEDYESTADTRAQFANNVKDETVKAKTKLKVVGKKALTPAAWIKEKSKALIASTSHKIYKWATEDVQNAIIESSVTNHIDNGKGATR